MQKKYLALALSSALAVALTGCGSDNDSSYTKNPAIEPGTGNASTGNTKPDNTKPDNTKPDNTKPDNPEPDNTKPDNTKPDNTKPDNTKPDNTKPDNTKPDNTKPDNTKPTGEIPTTPDPVDNPGDAAYAGRATDDSSSVGQQYLRGEQSSFDRVLNKTDDANATVYSWKTIQNKKLTNIVNGRETVKIEEADKALRRYAGQDGSEPNWDNKLSLQVWNGKSGDAPKDLNNQTLITKADGSIVKSQFADKYSNINVDGNFENADTNTDRNNANNGLVAVTTSARGKSYNIIGQDDQDLMLSDDGKKVEEVRIQGQNTPSRIFGAYYNQTDGLKDNKDGNSFKLVNTGKSSYEVKTIGTATSKYDAKKQSKYVENSAATNKFTLAADKIKLKNVQYGRVTTNIDPIEAKVVAAAQKDGEQSFFFSPYVDKFTYKKGDVLANANNHSVDTYFYRGVGETTLEQMNALPDNAVYTYNGHALMYGLDNAYHGLKGLGDTNSFTYGKDKVGLGNFVTATYNKNKRAVEGNIYNIWIPDHNEAATERDDLVKFSGQVVGNTVVNGTADRLYIDGDDKAAFKGSFYGDKAQELGGAINSVTEGYGDAKWGGVFGAQRETVKAPAQKPDSPDNANNID